MFTIRKATAEDISAISAVYTTCKEAATEKGGLYICAPDQWPDEAELGKAVEEGVLYAGLEGDEIRGAFFYAEGENIVPEYKDIDGIWVGADYYGTVTRMAVTDAASAAELLDRAGLICRHLRVDICSTNKVMYEVLVDNNFIRCGTLPIPGNDEKNRIALELIDNVHEEMFWIHPGGQDL